MPVSDDEVVVMMTVMLAMTLWLILWAVRRQLHVHTCSRSGRRRDAHMPAVVSHTEMHSAAWHTKTAIAAGGVDDDDDLAFGVVLVLPLAASCAHILPTGGSAPGGALPLVQDSAGAGTNERRVFEMMIWE